MQVNSALEVPLHRGQPFLFCVNGCMSKCVPALYLLVFEPTSHSNQLQLAPCNP